MQLNNMHAAKGTLLTAMVISICLIFYIDHGNTYKYQYSSDVVKEGKMSTDKQSVSDDHTVKQKDKNIDVSNQRESVNPELSTPLLATRTCTQQERRKHVTDMCRKLKQEFHPEVVPAHVNGDTSSNYITLHYHICKALIQNEALQNRLSIHGMR